MTEIKLNEAALAAAYKAYGHPGKTLTPIQDAIRAYLTADHDRAARDAVVEAARRVVHWSGALELCAPELGAAHTAIFALCAAVAAMPKEGE